MNKADDIPQSERRRILIEERRLRTYHGHAISAVDDERGGRYATEGSKQTVIGSSLIAYPQQPSTSPWHSDPCPPEPLIDGTGEGNTLGYQIDRPGSPPSSSDSGIGDGPTTDGTSEARPVTRRKGWRRV
jgi:hypothetical protein